MKLYIKTAANLLRKNVTAANFALIFPMLMYLLIKSAEWVIRCHSFIIGNVFFRELAILGVTIFFQLILLYPLYYGMRKCYFDNCMTHKIRFSGIFVPYETFSRFIIACTTILTKLIYKAIVVAALFFPCVWFLKISFSSHNIYLQFLSAMLIVFALFITISLFYSAFLTEYIVIAAGKNPISALFLSIKYMHKKRRRLFELKIRLFAPMLSGLLIIPAFYVLPLYFQTTALFAWRVIFYSPIFESRLQADI